MFLFPVLFQDFDPICLIQGPFQGRERDSDIHGLFTFSRTRGNPDYCSLYLRNDQQIWITTKIHIFTKGFKHIECGHFLRDHAGFHEHNEPRVVLDKLWHDIINSHTVTKHACTFSCLPLATQYTKYTITLQ